MPPNRTLLIGNNGYIGSRLQGFLQNYCYVQGVDIGWFGMAISDTLCIDFKDLDLQFLQSFDCVILLAGHSSVKMCDGPLRSSWKNNVINWQNLVSKLHRDQLFVYASSGSVYGGIGANDKHFVPLNFYDVTKHVIDLHAYTLIEQGRNIIGLRFGTVNGSSPNMRYDLMMNKMIKDALTLGEIIVYNSGIKRPILALDDLENAVLKCLLSPRAGIFNLASFDMQVHDIANNVSAITNVPIRYHSNSQPGYDFTMPTHEFQKYYDFKFQATVDDCVTDILHGTHVLGGTRDNYMLYE
jgi:UDP-glucose 4-epimerase